MIDENNVCNRPIGQTYGEEDGGSLHPFVNPKEESQLRLNGGIETDPAVQNHLKTRQNANRNKSVEALKKQRHISYLW